MTPREAAEVHVGMAEVWLALGERRQARDLALQALHEAWSDGAPYVRWWELQRALRVFTALGESGPTLPRFDPRKVPLVPYEREIRAYIAKLQEEQEKRAGGNY